MLRWGQLLGTSVAAKLLGTKNSASSVSQPYLPDYSSVWSDYPAYGLSQPLSAAPAPIAVNYLEGGVYNNPKKYGSNLGGPNGYRPKKDPIPGPPVLVSSGKPVFDILVEPEYVPDPFPVPYPYPIEEDYSDDLFLYAGPNDDKKSNLPEEDEDEKRYTRKKKPKYKKTNYIERSAAQWTCPKDYMEEGRRCVKYDVIDVEIGCTDGWEYRNAECFAVDLQAPDLVCPEGYSNAGLTCEKTQVAPKHMRCPENHFQTIHGCKQKVVADPVPRCVGSSIQNGICHRTKRLRPDPQCPNEFNLGVDQKTCLKDSVIAGHPTCPEGFSFDEHGTICEKFVASEPITTCPQGFVKEGSTCFRKLAHPGVRSCDFGILTDEGTCVTTKSLGKPNLSCPHGSILNAHMKCEVMVRTPASKNKKKKEPCDHGQKLIGDECVKTVFADPVYNCDADGSTLLGHECVVSLASTSIVSCPPGQVLDDETCYMNEATAVNTSCSGNFDLTMDGKCVKREVAHSALACPPGYKPGVDSLCHQIEKIEATLSCPASTSLKLDTDGSQQNYICYGVDTFEPTYSCPMPGLELESTSAGFKCTGWQLNEPEFVCAAGFTDDGGRCVKVESTNKHPVCPSEYAFSFDSCVKELKQPALYFCPDGYTHQKKAKTCTAKKYTELIPVCPEDMEFDNLVGECYKMNSDYTFDEKEKDSEKNLDPNLESLKDLAVTTTTSSTTVAPPAFGPSPLPFPMPVFTTPPPVAVPPPQLTIVQQPVVVPQPAVILPQQAPVPPPPAIRVPYGVPQPVPTAVRPLEHHTVHNHHVNTVYNSGGYGGYGYDKAKH